MAYQDENGFWHQHHGWESTFCAFANSMNMMWQRQLAEDEGKRYCVMCGQRIERSRWRRVTPHDLWECEHS